MNDKVCKWIISSEGYDIHYVREFVGWKEALISHIEWIYGKGKLDIYTKALNGFHTLKDGIEFFNTIFEDDKIFFMSPITDDMYIDEKQHTW